MLRSMRQGLLLGLWLMLAAGPAFGGAPVEQEGPLSPCVQTPDGTNAGPSAAQAQPWGVEIATAFSKEEALDEFGQVKQAHADLLGSYDPILIEQCDLHMGTKVQYSARIGAATRDDADALCTKLKAAGGACIVQKN
jgi:sporulation related protein